MGIFGSNPKEPLNEGQNLVDSKYQEEVQALQAEITEAREKLQESESKMAELQNKLDEYLSKERQIAEVMINAQINAQKIEAQARAKAEMLLQETDEELRRKNQELELLRIKSQIFRQELNERLDQYKISLEKIMEPNDEVGFSPTLVHKEKKLEKKALNL